MNYKVMDYMNNGVIIENMNTSEILFINKIAKKLLKVTSKDKFLKIRDFFSGETVYRELKQHIKDDLSNHYESEGTAYLKSIDGTFFEINFNVALIEEDILCYTFKSAVEVMGESEISFKELAEQLPSGIIVMNVENGLSITYANNEHYKILGIDNKIIKEQTYLLKDFVFQEDVHWVLSEIYMNLSKNEDVDIEFRMRTKDNVIKWVRLFGRANTSATGEKLFYSSLKDLSQRRSVNDKLHLERVMFHKITEITNEILFRLDLETKIMHFLGSKANIFGNNTVYENYPSSLNKLSKVHKDDIEEHSKLVYCLFNGVEKPFEIRYKTDENLGLYEWYRISYSFIKTDDGTPISAIGKMSNINTQKLLETRAKTDLLTGFYNKITTEQEVNSILSYSSEKSLAFYIIDIDNFKDINDNLGHHFGDMVLTGIADDIRSCFRQNDILGRIGGDEFIVVMRDISDTSIIVQKADMLCKKLRKTFSGGMDKNYEISASIGISMYPSDGNQFDELYKKSDKALYDVKQTGKNGYKQYYNELERKNISYTPKNDKGDSRVKTVLVNSAVMSTAFNLLYEANDFESTLFLVLEYMGKIFKVDKCSILETQDNGQTYNNTYNWCNPDIDKSINNHKIRKSDINNIINCVDDEGLFYSNDISEIKDDWTRTSLRNIGIKSALLVSNKTNEKADSILFIEDCKSKRVWSDEEIVTLLHLSRLISSTLKKHNIIKDLRLGNVCKDNESVAISKDSNDYADNALISHNQIANLVHNCCTSDNYHTSSMGMIQNIVELFKMFKATALSYNAKTFEYLKYYEYSVNSNFYEYSQDMADNYKSCIDVLTHTLDDNNLNFMKLFKGKDYLYIDDYSKYSDSLNSIGYKPYDEDNLKELYIYITNHTSFFGYMIFERYAETKLSDADVNVITALCDVINSNISKYDLVQKYETELQIRDVMLSNENTPIAVVEKDTYRILYHNDIYYDIFPNIKVNGICYELQGNTEQCSECCFDKDLLMNDANHKEHQWIKKAVPFTLKDGTDAYMIYSKDSIDYINKIKAVDNLTQALLFRGFEEFYNDYISKNELTYALYTLDVDKFKYINEIFGYKTGDVILRQIAIVIKNFIEEDESFCRLGEDKFAVLLHYDNEIDLHSRLKDLGKKFEGMKTEYFSDIKITINGGVTLVDRTISLNTLLDQSTIARKSAKGSHKNSFSYYNPEVDDKIKKEIQLEEQLPYAVQNDEFVAYLQPKFNVQTKEICGAEALVRWITPKGKIFPDQFIPLFERNGFILTLDFIIYEKVMNHIKQCIDNGLKVYPISVNVSRNHINDKNFINKFMDLINKYNVPREYIELEITESIFVADAQELKDFVSGMKDYKLKVSIDDFGSAYSSLQNLTDINVDILKIDKGFLDNIDMSQNIVTKDEILLKNIINLAKELNFHVICEGIETDEQVELLRKVGCEYGQGYVFARPMPIEDYEKLFLKE